MLIISPQDSEITGDFFTYNFCVLKFLTMNIYYSYNQKNIYIK